MNRRRWTALFGLVLLVAVTVGWSLPVLGPATAQAKPAAAPAASDSEDGSGAPRLALSERPPGALPSERGPSSVIFPLQSLPLHFDHEKHISALGLGCGYCHSTATTSRQGADRLLPDPRLCDDCHGSDHSDLTRVRAGVSKTSVCQACHVGYTEGDGNRVARVVLPKPQLRFDHAVHARRNIGCAQCHGSVEKVQLATRDQLPRMKGCFRCHQQPEPARGKARGECTTCHLAERPGRMRTELASGSLLPPHWLHGASHGPDWIERHKRVAAANSEFCSSCHSEDECVACHDGRVRPRRLHPNDWLNQHAVAARQQDCTSCHRAQSFCVSCHQRVGLAPSGPSAARVRTAGYHPSGWTGSGGDRSPGHHGWEAQRNLSACVSCHVERDCVACHATAALGGRGVLRAPGGSVVPGQGLSPHPAGFAGRCARPMRRNPRPCLACHSPADPSLERCR